MKTKIHVQSSRRRLGAWCLGVCLVAGVSLGQAQLPNGSVSGIVVQAVNQAPMPGVLVLMTGVGQATTDENGRFRILNVRPGTFSIAALRTGLAPPLGDTFSGRVAVGPGEDLDNVRLQLAPFGVIRGRVLDENGDPLRGIAVTALVEAYVRGHRVLQSPTSGMTNLNGVRTLTDDRGEYQIEVPPGIYYLAADYRKTGTPDVSSAGGRVSPGVTRIYYPRAQAAELAAYVRVPGGGETPGVDITVDSLVAKGVTVSGRIEGRGSSPAQGRPPRRFQFISRSYLSWDGPTSTEYFDAAPQAGDNFEIQGVPPGVYDLVFRDVMEDGEYGLGAAPVDVRDEDVSGITLVLHADQTFVGRIVTEEGNSSIDFSSLSVVYGTQYAVPSPDGSFTMTGVSDTTYPVSIENLPPDAYVSDIRQGGRSLLESARTLNGPELDGRVIPSPLLISLNANGARLDGSVETLGLVSVAGATVVLVPSEQRRFVPSYYKAAVVGGSGNFTLQGIAPGTYQLYAFDNVPETAWMNPSFLARFEGRGQSISFSDGSLLSARLRIVSVSR